MEGFEKSKLIKEYALALGFEACGIAHAEKLNDEEVQLRNWLKAGYHADMHWMEHHVDKRLNPGLLVPEAKSVIVVLKNYNIKDFPFENRKYKIARYALGMDYHKVIKKQLKKLYNYIDQNFGPIKGRYFVDSGPVLERTWAVKAGLGWIGKNSLLLNRKFGSFCFIGELIIDIELFYDKPINTLCGTCTNCIDACPTGAIVRPAVIDSRKCISYQTIENKGEIDSNVKTKLSNWIFGCDICQEVCPWNWRAPEHNEPLFKIKPALNTLSDRDIENIDEKTFNQIFEGSAIKRAKFIGLSRNIQAVKSNN